MAKPEKERPKESESFHRLRNRVDTVNPKHLNAMDWLSTIHMLLQDSCREFLREIAEKNSKARPLLALLNHPIEKGSFGEKRITSEDMINALDKKFIINSKWLFIPIKVLETSETKGQFLERTLFILADLAELVIVDVKFRKVPIPDQRLEADPPRINEEVVKVTIVEGFKEGRTPENFLDLAIPYFSDTTLGEGIVDRHLEDVIDLVRESGKKAKKDLETIKLLIQVRSRLGIHNQLD